MIRILAGMVMTLNATIKEPKNMNWIRQIVFLCNRQMWLFDAGKNAHPWAVLMRDSRCNFTLIVGTGDAHRACVTRHHEVLPTVENQLTKKTYFIPVVRIRDQNFLDHRKPQFVRGCLSESDHLACSLLLENDAPTEPGGK